MLRRHTVATIVLLAAACVSMTISPARADDLESIETRRSREVREMMRGLRNDADLRAAMLRADASSGRIGLGALRDEEDTPADPPASATKPAAASSKAGDLARAAQNPVSDMINLPFQNNTNFNVGTMHRTQNVLNIQPVIPLTLNANWNVITRTIVPLIYQPAIFPGDDYDFGLGDIQFTAFFSPKKPVGGWILGAGPVLQFPTATDSRLGAGKWTAGPSIVALRMDGPWVFGGIVQNVWSYAGWGDQDVNAMLVQPFVNYNLADGWYLSSSPIITANWKANSANRWTVPIGGGVGKIFHIGHQPVNAQIQGFYNVVTPEQGPDWTLRLQFQLLFPR